MSGTEEKPCPVCGGEMEDARHVTVECFYDVHEVAPSALKVPVLVEVPADHVLLGITRRYPEGTRDEHSTVPHPEGGKVRFDTRQVPTPAVRLLEGFLYTVTCCKSCRGDFLTMFGTWARGDLAMPSEPTETHNIPVRINGAIRYITEEEWHRRRAAGL